MIWELSARRRELHPWAVSGIASCFVMVYAPEDEVEIETVLAIARASHRFAVTPAEDVRP